MGTKDQLVFTLVLKPQSDKRDRIMEKAVKGFYHDFESPLACPKVQLVHDLTVAGLEDVALDVKRGVYDE